MRAYYGLSGDPDVIKKDVEWLLKDSHFVYGGIDLKVCILFLFDNIAHHFSL